MKALIHNTKGTSLALVTGLILLIFTAAVATNELVIRSLQSVGRIEASNKAFLAAEGGVEDALYELSVHSAGYNTPDLSEDNRRGYDFDNSGDLNTGSPRWNSEWAVETDELNTCTTDICGKLYEDQRANIPFYRDAPASTGAAFNGIGVEAQNIQVTPGILIDNLTIKLPQFITHDEDNNLRTAFNGSPALQIDNDNDALGQFGLGRINEDGEGDMGSCPGSGLPTNDTDCDGREDEDSPEHPVVLWRISDGTGNSLSAKKGCLTEAGSEFCEKDFESIDNFVEATLAGTDNGVATIQNPNGTNFSAEDHLQEMMINSFLSKASSNADRQLQLELSIIAPMKHYDDRNNPGDPKYIPLPYLEYELDVNGDGKDSPATTPYPFFQVQSDGYFRDFKQSITTTLSPRTIVPLFDFTVIQQ